MDLRRRERCISFCAWFPFSMTGIATFAIPPTFLGITRKDPGAPLCIAGIPYDLGTSNRPGSRFGPSAIRRASRMLVDGEHPLHWVNPASAPLADIGDFTIALGDIAKSLAEIERQAGEIAHLVALGGDHGITLPLLRALAKRRGPPALIHLDAHVDTWPENFGQTYAHGSVFYQAPC
jgi:agmatinase